MNDVIKELDKFMTPQSVEDLLRSSLPETATIKPSALQDTRNILSRADDLIKEHRDLYNSTMKVFSDQELKQYLDKISDHDLYAYNVYQIEAEGRNLFSNISGDENTIMGLPIKKIKQYLETIK